MDFGVCVLTKIDEVGIVAHAENLGYSHAWVPDSQMIWSDCYAFLALAAQQTRKINIGTGVSVVGTRVAPVTAHSIATINRLAPGRTFLGLGTGNTAQRLMGQRPVLMKEYEEYLRVLRALLHGEEVDYTYKGKTFPIKFLMQDLKFMECDPPVPMHVSGFGPRAQGIAGKYGDALVVSIPPNPAFMTRAMSATKAGAEEIGRDIGGHMYTSSLTTVVIQEPGEPLDSDRIKEECGAFVMSSVHYIYEKIKEQGGDPPPHMRSFWKEYCALLDPIPPERRHMRVHDGHCTYLLPEEARFLTPELIKTTCIAGTEGEVLEQVKMLADAGLDQIILLPSMTTQYRVVENFSRRIMSKVA